MRFRILIMSVIFAMALAAPQAYAKQGASSGKPDKAARQQRQDAEKNVERRDEMRQRGDQERDAVKDHTERTREDAEERAEVAREQAERARDGDVSRDYAEDGEGRLRGRENAETRGNETSQEMRARRDERKQIKDEYKEGREAGQEGVDLDNDPEERTKEQQEKAKKPWWKFWGD